MNFISTIFIPISKKKVLFIYDSFEKTFSLRNDNCIQRMSWIRYDLIIDLILIKYFEDDH